MSQRSRKKDDAGALLESPPVVEEVEPVVLETAPVEVPPVEEVAAPAQVRVVNISLDSPEYVPLANGALHRLDPKEHIDVDLTDVTDATRLVQSAGRIVINPL